jgi:folate-binding protein YgfZ
MLTEYYKAAREHAVLAEMDWFGIMKLTGTERVQWLQGMVTNDVQKLRPGEGCSAAHLTAQGKIVAHMTVLADEDALWFSLERAVVPKLVKAFDKLLISEDVQIADVSEDHDVLSVIGPDATAILADWFGESLKIDRPHQHRRFDNCRVVVSDLGYDVWVPRGQADKILRALAQSGATAIDHGTWDVLRTEAGLPVYGVDIDETTTLPEIGERSISYEKGCYVGQEVVAKIKYIGHVNRRFVGLTITGHDLPELRSPLRKDGKDVGYITTTLVSPALNKPIALGFLSLAAYAPGTEVEIVGKERIHRATVVELPFVKRAL